METTHPYYPTLREWRRDLKAKNRSRRTIGNYDEGVRMFAKWLDERDGHESDPEEATTADVRDWLGHLADTRRPSTAATRFQHLAQWFKFLCAEGIVDVDPMVGMTTPHVPEIPVPVVSDGLVHRVLATCHTKSFRDIRDEAIIRLFFDTGGRLSEIMATHHEQNPKRGARPRQDIDLDLDVLHVIGKGGRPRALPFSPKTGRALSRYLRVRAKHKLAHRPELWLSTYGAFTRDGAKTMLRRRGQRAGINDAIGRNLHAHLGRHYQSNAFLEAGGSESDLMRLNGWKSNAMPRRYGAANADSRAQRAARQISVGDRL